MDFVEADQMCRKINPASHLATPTNIYHMSFLAANLYSVGHNTWIGVRSTSTQDKSFHWINAEPQRLGYVYWDTISPRGMDGDNKDRLCVAGIIIYNFFIIKKVKFKKSDWTYLAIIFLSNSNKK